MPEEAKVSVYSGLQQLVLQLASHEGGGWHRLSAAGKRLCLTLAAAAVHSGSTAEDTTHPPTHHARTLPPYLPAIDRWHALFAVPGRSLAEQVSETGTSPSVPKAKYRLEPQAKGNFRRTGDIFGAIER